MVRRILAIAAGSLGFGIPLVAYSAGFTRIVSPLASNFVTVVVSTKPLGYYRLEKLSGPSQVGSTTYTATGGVAVAKGAPTEVTAERGGLLDGKSGYYDTTQMGGITTTASMMAWVKLAALPSQVGHFFYVCGESQNGNDLDLQFETDNILKFFTASGSNLDYTPNPKTLVGHWHFIVVTLDTNSGNRAIYWDGKLVASDTGGGNQNKTTEFTIGESVVFTGRFFDGDIDEVALWNTALTPKQVTAMWTAAL